MEESRQVVRPLQDKSTLAIGSKIPGAKKLFTAALERSLSRPSRVDSNGSKITAIANWVVDIAEGVYDDIDPKTRLEAVKFIADRMEGRPSTQIEYTGTSTSTRIVLKWQDSHIQPDMGDDPLTPISYETLEPGEYTELPSGDTD